MAGRSIDERLMELGVRAQSLLSGLKPSDCGEDESAEPAPMKPAATYDPYGPVSVEGLKWWRLFSPWWLAPLLAGMVVWDLGMFMDVAVLFYAGMAGAVYGLVHIGLRVLQARWRTVLWRVERWYGIRVVSSGNGLFGWDRTPLSYVVPGSAYTHEAMLLVNCGRGWMQAEDGLLLNRYEPSAEPVPSAGE